jgi:hypothetical protein
MKKIFLVFFFAVLGIFATAQKNDYVVSFDGIGGLQLGMGKAELEKLLKMKIVLKHIHVDQVYTETIHGKYLGMDVELYLMRSEDKVAYLEAVAVTNPVFKTAEGIGIGTDQSTIIDKYEDQLLIMHPDYSEDGTRKNSYTIKVAYINNYHSSIIFTMVNKKVVAIQVAPTPEFRDRE